MTTKPRKPRKSNRNQSDAPSQFAKGHRPHNARSAPPITSVEELVRRIAAEPRQAVVGSRTVTMSLAERRLRSEIEAGIKGEARALERVVKLMIKYPHVVASQRRHIIVRLGGALYDV